MMIQKMISNFWLSNSWIMQTVFVPNVLISLYITLCRVCSKRSNQSVHNTLRKLSNDSLIKVCKFDKRNGVAILESEDYYAKLDKIDNDKTKFVEIWQDTDIVSYIMLKICALHVNYICKN